tara:strand:+ start:3375 stop:4475 length:1101 start_codon:yes stop_codon:yes gene_type:complete
LPKNRKEIIFFCPQISDGGLEKTLINYLNYFSKNNAVSLITNTNNHKQLKLINKKVKIINFKIKYLIQFRLVNNLFCAFQLLKFLKNKTIIFSMQDHFFILLFKFFGLKKKLVIRTPTAIFNNKNSHESIHLNRMHLLKKIIINFYKYSNLVITFSENNKKFLQNNLKVKNVEVIYNYFPKFSGNKKIKKNYNIFFIGRLAEDKDPVFFIQNTIKLINTFNFKIHIIGKGELLNQLKVISKNNLKHVKYYGYIKNPLIKYHKIIDLICVTSKYDGTPNIIGEALSYKIPCIAPTKVGLSDFVFSNGKYGYLYKPGDDKSFQKKILEIFNNYNVAINKAKKGYNSLNRFSKKNTLGKLEEILNRSFQ